jgi:hypothetical protein
MRDRAHRHALALSGFIALVLGWFAFMLLVGALIMLPAVLGYTAFSCSVVRGKVVAGEGYG